MGIPRLAGFGKTEHPARKPATLRDLSTSASGLMPTCIKSGSGVKDYFSRSESVCGAWCLCLQLLLEPVGRIHKPVGLGPPPKSNMCNSSIAPNERESERPRLPSTWNVRVTARGTNEFPAEVNRLDNSFNWVFGVVACGISRRIRLQPLVLHPLR